MSRVTAASNPNSGIRRDHQMASPNNNKLAVCLQGRMEPAPVTAIGLRKFLLDAWDADAFVVAYCDRQGHTTQGLLNGVGHTRLKGLRCAKTASELFRGLPYADLVNQSGVWSRSFHAIARTRYSLGDLASQLLMRSVCANMIFAFERRFGVRYGVFARVRLDTLLFEPLPAPFLTRSIHEAVIPSGEDYGDSGEGLMDKMLFGRRRAFEADAAVWQTLLAGGKLLSDNWIHETLHRIHLVNVSRLSIRRIALAYCIVDSDGRCRFGGELTHTLEKLGGRAGNSLLGERPQLCAHFVPDNRGTPCNVGRFVQVPEDMRQRDPGLCELAATCVRASRHSWASPQLQLPWPAPPFTLACPDTPDRCSALVRYPPQSSCQEPESETSEVLSSLLANCQTDACTYVDVGCNIGYFAGLAAAHGATVECYEAAPLWVEAASRLADINSFHRMRVYHRAVVVNNSGPPALHFSQAWHPCGIADGHPAFASPWMVRTQPLDEVLGASREVTLLKLDIDSNEGALLHVATDRIQAGLTSIRSILVELGDFAARFAAHEVAGSDEPHARWEHRSGNLHDLWRLQRLGYDVYRINIHVNHEIFDWQGYDVNTRPSKLNPAYRPMRNLRTMRKLEFLKPHATSEGYARLLNVGWAQSFLITKVRLMQPTKHHWIDLMATNLSHGLNEGLPCPSPHDACHARGGRHPR